MKTLLVGGTRDGAYITDPEMHVVVFPYQVDNWDESATPDFRGEHYVRLEIGGHVVYRHELMPDDAVTKALWNHLWLAKHQLEAHTCPTSTMIVIRFGRWSNESTNRYTYTRIYWRGYRWTPLCRRSKRYER